jgi:hypothetical protein
MRRSFTILAARASIALAFALTFALTFAPTLRAQETGLAASAVIIAPTYAAYSIGGGKTEKRVDQYSSPFAFIIPVTKTFTIDFSTSYAASTVTSNGAVTSSIAGMTDTQVRGSLIVFDQHVALTLGLNLPTGRYTVTADQQEAAGQIGNSFLMMPVGGMGVGPGGTMGLAFAERYGAWNLGLSGSVRKTGRFDAFQLTTGVLRFEPGDEYRLRVGVDRPLGNGSFSGSLNYSKFGPDIIDSSAFPTGDRIMLQSSLALPIGDNTLSIGFWDMYRLSGEMIGTAAPWENVADLSIGWSIRGKLLSLQTSVEQRIWQIEGARAGDLTNFGIGAQFNIGSFTIVPSSTVAIGKLHSAEGGPTADLQGIRGQLLIRWH